jgi:hypothetical protein
MHPSTEHSLAKRSHPSLARHQGLHLSLVTWSCCTVEVSKPRPIQAVVDERTFRNAQGMRQGMRAARATRGPQGTPAVDIEVSPAPRQPSGRRWTLRTRGPVSGGHAVQVQEPSSSRFSRSTTRLVNQHCASCHHGTRLEACASRKRKHSKPMGSQPKPHLSRFRCSLSAAKTESQPKGNFLAFWGKHICQRYGR